MTAPPTERLYNLLPAFYRVHDFEQGEPLRALLSVIEGELQAVEADIDGLYANWFIETCDEWIVPYLGDLLGVRGLHPAKPGIYSQRAYVANTLAYRRRKGTAAVLEQLARDITGWDARAVEFFDRLATTANVNHTRTDHPATLSLHRWEPLQRLNTPFDDAAHSADVRRIVRGRGRYNIPNVGIFLWRIGAYALTESPAVKVDDHRYRFSPLGNDMPLYNRPQTQAQITELARPIHVPMPLSRRVLDRYLTDYYGDDKSLLLWVNDAPVPVEDVIVCDLSDAPGNTWAHPPTNHYAMDPELGRLALPTGKPLPDPNKPVRVSFHYGFSAEIGGGEYRRADTFATDLDTVVSVPSSGAIQTALDSLSGDGVVEIPDSGRYTQPLTIQAKEGQQIELRAADTRRPTLVLSQTLEIGGDTDSQVTLNGLLLSGFGLHITGKLRRLRLVHCTLVPGLTLTQDGEPPNSDTPSLTVETTTAAFELEIENCIVGGLRVVEDAHVHIRNSIVDATAENRTAYGAPPDGKSPGAPLVVENSTVIGKIYARILELVSNSILLASRAAGETVPAVRAQRRQEGCARFSFLPFDSESPRRFHCQPTAADQEGRVRPQFNALRYGRPDYAQLSLHTPPEIRQGADDESEIGAFHDLYQPQREADLRLRLEEYLPFGLEAGIFYGS